VTARTTPDAETLVAVDPPYDLARTLAINLRGRGDASMRIAAGAVARAGRTREGPAATLLERVPGGVRVRAWGPGAHRAVADAPALIGAVDDPSGLATEHPLVTELQRRFAGVRIGRTGAILEALVPAILEQKVTGQQARRGLRGLASRYGEPAPGPLGLRVPPPPATLASLPYYAYHPFEIERRRAETIIRVAREAERLERLVGRPPTEVYAALRRIPGVGPWTCAEVGIRALGDVDAVSVGDFHLAHLVGWALAGEPRATDERMLELLEPFRGQRGRVVRLLELSGIRPPAYGPGLAPRRIAGD
jgi:3-methyladenine DNA glycosylase/8-oxoguanine DNA glycosylase